MIEKRCRTCFWWDNDHPRLAHAPEVAGIDNPGFCRKHRPSAYMLKGYQIGCQPIMDADEGCAEYREGGK